jgi:acyl-CoA synthetase (AMP-forming)/AMP-acid ligase II
VNLLHPSARVVDAVTGETLTEELIEAEAAVLADQGLSGEALVMLPIETTIASIARYLAALRLDKPVLLLDPDGGHNQFAERFRADTVHPDLAVLLTTSGSTGNPKLVRLSRSAVRANAEQIAEALAIDGNEVAITTLPLFYSYGMSVLNSHLIRGATVVLERTGIMQRTFWNAAVEHQVTSMAFVPSQYEMLRRLRFDPSRYPALRTLTQAGGRLRTERITEFAQKMATVGGRLYVMYGQTEAGPRMSTVPAAKLADKIGSAGPALPGGQFVIRTDDGTETTEPDVVGEVLYRGPNVMMGYAEGEAELAEGDSRHGVLETGDLGRLDADGYLFITGRLKRIGKVFGNRVNLDDLEQLLRGSGLDLGAAAAVPAGDKVVVWVEDCAADTRKAAARTLAEKLHLHVSGFDVRDIDALPLLASGKVDYRSLEGRA